MSTNEWSQLKKVIVGVADFATIPPVDISLRTVNYANELNEAKIPNGAYPDQVIHEANEDLDILANFLQKEGVEVVRPKRVPVKYYNYCPRDTVLVHGDQQLATPMSLLSRRDEYTNIQQHLSNLTVAQMNYDARSYNLDCIGDPEVLALHNHYPIFDAANVIRANNDLLYLVSNSGNKAGAEYLQQWVSSSATVHTLEGVYSYMHIDSTVAFLREGLMLLNPSRIKSKNILPEPFCSWDVIWCPEPVDIGHYPGYCNASTWINMNLLSVNENLVILEEHQTPLRKKLEQHNIECAMLPMRHQRTLGGGFHCVTLDLLRTE